MLSPARRAARTRKGRTGIIRFTSASPKPAKARTAASRAPSASARCCATASATPSASRSPRTAVHEIPVAQALVRARPAANARPRIAARDDRRLQLRSVLAIERRAAAGIDGQRRARAAARKPCASFTTRERGTRSRTRFDQAGDVKPEIVYRRQRRARRSIRATKPPSPRSTLRRPQLVTVKDGCRSRRHRRVPPARRASSIARHPILLKDTLHPAPIDATRTS